MPNSKTKRPFPLSSPVSLLGLGGLAACSPLTAIVARADVFLSEDQAAHAIFPKAAFKRRELTLTDEQAKKIKEASGQNVRRRKVVAFVSPHGTVIIDEVLGKHEFITFAVGIRPDGSVQGIEILEYKETYGGQVRGADWRQQFTGKNARSELELESDIRNISGATLSCAHVTGGVKRLLQTFEALKPEFEGKA